MPKEETIQQIKIRNVLGEKEDLPSLNARNTLSSLIKAQLMQTSGVSSLMHTYGSLGLNETLTLASGENIIVSMVSDGTNLYAGTSGATIAKIDLSDFTELSSLTLPYSNIMDLALDGTYLYVLHYNQAISRVRLADFTLVDSLSITLGDMLWSLAIDGTYLYASSSTLPGSIVRVNLSTFTETDAFTPGADVVLTTNLYTDGFNLYAAAQILVGSNVILKISLATFTQVDRIDNVGYVTTASKLTSDGLYLYAISYESPGVVYQIDLSTFTIVKVLTFSASDTWPKSSFFNGTYLFVGCSLTGVGRIVVIDVFDLSIITTILLGSVGTADAIFSDGTYLYIGTSDSPGKIVRQYIIPTLDFSQKKIDSTNICVQSVISATTSDGAGDGTTLVDTARTEGDDYWNGLTLLIQGGSYKGQARRILDFDAASDTITVSPGFGGQILSDVKYTILPTIPSSATGDATLANQTLILNDIGDFSARANDNSLLDVIGLPDVAGKDLYTCLITDRLDNATYGLSAIETLVDSLETDVTTLKAQMITNVSMMEFWSTIDDIITLTTATADVDLPDVVVADIPANTTIVRSVGMIKCRAINNTNAAANAINGAAVINVKHTAGVWGWDDTGLIDIPDNIWSVVASTKEGGMLVEGTYDASDAVVYQNGTYNLRFVGNIFVDGNNLELIDVMVGLKVYFKPT